LGGIRERISGLNYSRGLRRLGLVEISAASLFLLGLGVVCVEFGVYLFAEYSPLSHSVSDPNVILKYPIGLALMLGGVACVVAGLLEIEMTNFRRKVGELDGKTGQLRGEVAELRGEVAELRGEVGKITETVDRLGRESDKLTKKTDKLTTKAGELTTTTKARFERLSAILKKKKNGASKSG
jgi:septal ring factor EnvC (AmiA/AmiB activator)